jgi:pyruvate dehydrogenase E2 component (dihydrolipoamide acetyltransferase)
MPQLGLTMTEGTVVAWLKAAGEPVIRGEPVVEIETDKVTTQVEAPADGVLGPILVPAGGKAPIGGVLSRVLTAEEQGSRGAGEREGRPDLFVSPRIFATPRARRTAAALGIELAQVEASGPGGRIVEADVRWQVARSLAPSATPPITPLRGIRRVVAERMQQSFTTAPHFYLTVEVEATALVRMSKIPVRGREGLLAKVEAAFSARPQSDGVRPQSDGVRPQSDGVRPQSDGVRPQSDGVRLTISDILVKVCAQALREFPAVNVAWTDEGGGGLRQHPDVNVGVAVALDVVDPRQGNGLVVPVIHQADRLTLAEIARRRADLVERARAGKLTLTDLEGGTFTLSNLGMFGVDQFQAIINPPQSAILAVGRIKDRPVALEGAVVVRPTMHLTLSADHRQLDGAQAARFLERVAKLIEEPYLLLS